MKLTPSGSQTVGPYFRIGLQHLCTEGVKEAPAGSLLVTGKVLDAEGVPVTDAMLEVFYAGGDGEPRSGEQASKFIRVPSDGEGQYRFAVERPAALNGDAGTKQAPHLAVLVFSRGLLRHLITRMYFPDEPANMRDAILQSVEPERQQTLIARPDPRKPGALEWNVVLQGEDETVFFAW